MRKNILPIQHPDIWEMYKKAEAQFWRASDGKYAVDEFNDLTDAQKKYLTMLLCFFSVSDAIVSDNIALNFIAEDIPEEAKFWYAYQIVNENIHNETYGKLIELYITNENEKMNAFNAVETIPTVRKKVTWANRWITNGSFEEKLIAFIAVEAILFSTTFAGIFAFKDMRKKLDTLYWANIEISRDEKSHYEFAIYFYQNYCKQLTNEQIRRIILESYEIELQFIKDCFEFNPEGLNKEKMIQYLQYVVDVVLERLNLNAHFNVTQPFPFMYQLAINTRDNFFEQRSTQYTAVIDSNININENF